MGPKSVLLVLERCDLQELTHRYIYGRLIQNRDVLAICDTEEEGSQVARRTWLICAGHILVVSKSTQGAKY